MSSASSPGFPVVGIGASAGGIKALKQFFAKMPADCGMAFVVIVHLSQEHESNLAAILQTDTSMPVCQVMGTMPMERNKVYVIPPAKHLALMDGIIMLKEPQRIRGKRVPIDLFFRTLADAYEKNAIAMVLSGTGSDGTLGLKRVKENGGITIAQDPADAEYDGMPRNAIATGLVDVVLPIADIPDKLVSISRFAQKLTLPKEVLKPPTRKEDGETEDALREVLNLLRIRSGHDFSNYKRPTLLRRIARRLVVHELESIAAYKGYLRENPDEVQSLLRDLLITVTNFFRDKEAFDYLEKEIVPLMFAGKGPGDMVRAWVCGCATGEEAYSLSILLHEYRDRLEDPPKIQVFASDINEDAIKVARDGRYDDTLLADVTPERVQHYFTKKGDSYCISKEIRESVLFAPHNVLRDPPFSRLDLVTCRNLLIYLNRETQERVMEVFSFALQQNGHLFLGSSESAEGSSSLFGPVDKKFRVFRSLGTVKHRPLPVLTVGSRWEAPVLGKEATAQEQGTSFGALHHKLVEQYAPPSVLVNEEYDIVHSSEQAGRYLVFTGGEPTRNLLKTIHPALQLDLRATLMASKQDGIEVQSGHIPFTAGQEEHRINLIVRPVVLANTLGHLFLVIFSEEKELPKETAPLRTGDALDHSAVDAVVQRLEDNLQNTRDRLRATIEQSEVSVEELKASNEELQAMNEELRSASEELETSKEELQSLNEELTTVNLELKDKVEEVSRVNADLQNLMHATDIGTIFLDRSLRIKRYTPRVTEIFNIITSDTGRPFEHLTHKLDYDRLPEDAAQVLQSLRVVEREVNGGSHHGSYIARIAPYRTMDDRIDGVVISFLDVTELKRATETLRDRELSLRLAQKAAKVGVWLLNLKTGKAWWSEECYKLHGIENGSVEMTTRNWFETLHPNSVGHVTTAMNYAVETHGEYNFEIKVPSSSGERYLIEVGRAIYTDSGDALQMAGITLDITERILWREEQVRLLGKIAGDKELLEKADRRKDEFLATLAHELRNPLAPLRSGLEIVLSGADAAKTEEALGMMNRQLQHLVRLVDDLMDIARITQNCINLQKTRISMIEVVGSAVESCQSAVDEGQLTLRTTLPEDPIWVEADATRLSQVLTNLLHNACKYTHVGGTITLTISAEDGMAVIRIADNGVGFEREKLPNLFEMFSRLDRAGIVPGLGIGLHLVKSLVELHGGTVGGFSAGPGKGSEFVVRLPLAPELAGTPASPAPSAERASNGRSKRVLVVDDNEDGARSLATLLERSGHQTSIAFDGRQALTAAETFKPEAVILDLGLPDMDGCNVAEALRKNFPHAILIALTGWGEDHDRLRSRNAGFDVHLVKPASFERIKQALGGPR